MTEIYIVGGQRTDTFSLTSSDSVQRITSSLLKSADGRFAMQARITLENNPIRYAFNIHPVQTFDTRLGHILDYGEELLIKGYDQIRLFRFINKFDTQDAVLQISLSHFSKIKEAHLFMSRKRRITFVSKTLQNQGVQFG